MDALAEKDPCVVIYDFDVLRQKLGLKNRDQMIEFTCLKGNDISRQHMETFWTKRRMKDMDMSNKEANFGTDFIASVGLTRFIVYVMIISHVL